MWNDMDDFLGDVYRLSIGNQSTKSNQRRLAKPVDNWFNQDFSEDENDESFQRSYKHTRDTMENRNDHLDLCNEISRQVRNTVGNCYDNDCIEAYVQHIRRTEDELLVIPPINSQLNPNAESFVNNEQNDEENKEEVLSNKKSIASQIESSAQKLHKNSENISSIPSSSCNGDSNLPQRKHSKHTSDTRIKNGKKGHKYKNGYKKDNGFLYREPISNGFNEALIGLPKKERKLDVQSKVDFPSL